MARHCKICKIKLSFWHRKNICKDCQLTKFDHYLIGDNISELVDLDNEELTKIAQFGQSDCSHLYNKIFKLFLKYERLTKKQIESLRKISNAWSLRDKTIPYAEKNRQEEIKKKEREKLEGIQYIIKSTDILPKINTEYFEQLNFKLPENEKYFVAGNANYFQIEVLNSYQSSGRKYSDKGPKLKSEGDFIISWKKFYFIPKSHGRLITIDLSKIVKYDMDGTFLRIRKEGREKAYLFQMNYCLREVCKMGLKFLLNRK